MGTIVHQGSGRGVVVATGAGTAFGKIAVGLGERQAETAFQAGLRGFSKLLVKVAAVLTVSIFVINVAFHRPLIDAAAVLAGDRDRDHAAAAAGDRDA